MDEAVAHSIRELLAELERTECVSVCLAVESGSRAWGFASTDSDYDVRFIYVHRPEWYLSIDEGRDVIERPLTGAIDLSGWDLRKALRLFRKSNPPLLEWLQSPFVYTEKSSLAARMRTMLPRIYNPDASFFHYLHMAQGNKREYLSEDIVWREKYLYVLRPLLAMRWIEQSRGVVPMEFERLVEGTGLDPAIRRAIAEFVETKRAGAELDRGPKIPVISAFIDAELARLETIEQERQRAAPAVEELNRLFRAALDESWADRSGP